MTHRHLLMELVGHLMPATSSTFRLRLLIGGACAVVAGLILLTGAVEGMMPSGAGILACGVALVGMSAFDAIRAGRRREASAAAERLRLEEVARTTLERRIREGACEGHDWELDDQALNLDVWTWRCRKCGAETDQDPRP